MHVPAAREAIRRPLVGELVRFAAVGLGSTLAYVMLYVGLRTPLGPAGSNLSALAVTTIGNTAANRRLTFGVTGADGLIRDHLGGALAFGIALALTTGAIAVLRVAAPTATWQLEVLVLLAASLVATAVRFSVLRRVVRGRLDLAGPVPPPRDAAS